MAVAVAVTLQVLGPGSFQNDRTCISGAWPQHASAWLSMAQHGSAWLNDRVEPVVGRGSWHVVRPTLRVERHHGRRPAGQKSTALHHTRLRDWEKTMENHQNSERVRHGFTETRTLLILLALRFEICEIRWTL